MVCDHAGSVVPEYLVDDISPTQDGRTVELCDFGAERLARDVARSLHASVVLQNYSRTVADCARPREHVDFITGTKREVSREERDRRHASIVQPYYKAIRDEVTNVSRGRFILIISIHTVDVSQIINGSVLLSDARGSALSARGRALSVLCEELQRLSLLGAPSAGGPPFAGEHLAVAGDGLAAGTITIKVSRERVGDPKFVSWLRDALLAASRAANDVFWPLHPSRLARTTAKRVRWAIAIAVPAAAAVLGLAVQIHDQYLKQEQEIAHYELVIDGHHRDVTDVLVGVSHEIRLANRVGRAETFPDALVCRLQEAAARLANIVVQESGCTFKVTGSRTLFADNHLPQETPFGLYAVDDSGRQSVVPETVLVFQPFARPTPNASVDSVALEGTVVARLEPGTDGAPVMFSDCTWQPAELAVKFDSIKGGCQATFVARPSSGSGKTMSIFVRATATIGKSSFPVSSNDAVVTILPREPRPTIAAPPSMPALPPPTIAPSSHNPASDRPEEVVAHSPLTASAGPTTSQTALPTGVVDLIRSIRYERDNDRYIALRDGLANLSATTQLNASEALSLLGPLSGTLRTRALTNWVLPRMSLPIPAEGGVSLIGSLAPFDRVELLHDLGGCALTPLSEQQQAQLLSGVFGVARERATATLTIRQADCSKRATAAN